MESAVRDDDGLSVSSLKAKFKTINQKRDPLLFGVRQRAAELRAFSAAASEVYENAPSKSEKHQVHAMRLDALDRSITMLERFHIT